MHDTVTKVAPYLASIILVVVGLLMLAAAIVATFSIPGKSSESLTTMIVMGSLLVVLGALLPRLTGELEFGPKGIKAKLRRLDATVKKAERAIPPAPEPHKGKDINTYSTEQATEQILDEAAKSPRTALIHLGVIIERQTRLLLAKTNWLNPDSNLSFAAVIDYLEERKSLSINLTSSLRAFWEVRSALIHNSKDQNDEDILRGIDIGLTILKMIDGIPHEKNVVFHPGVEVFEDEECSKRRPGVLGLILDTTSPGGAMQHKRIFPTTRTYKKGQELSWEWSFDNIWGETWYKDPETGEKRLAWGSSAEFIGRPLEDIR